MIERRDEELSHIYRDAEGPRPPQRVDDNILAASQRVAGNVRRPAFGLPRRFRAPVALAATVLVTFTLALMVFERQSGVDALAPMAPPAGRTPKASPAAPVRAEQPAKSAPAEPRAEASAKSPPAELRSAAPAPVTPTPRVAPVERKPPTVETALSSERRATGQPARVPAVPPGVEILRKSEEPKPAPAAAGPAANARAGTLPPQPPVSDAQRVFDAQQQIRPAQAPAAAPAPSSNVVRESAPTFQGASAGAAIGSRLAVPEANERTPEKWLADIRKLKTEGKAIEVERELAEFKKRYPDYILPEDLR